MAVSVCVCVFGGPPAPVNADYQTSLRSAKSNLIIPESPGFFPAIADLLKGMKKKKMKKKISIYFSLKETLGLI